MPCINEWSRITEWKGVGMVVKTACAAGAGGGLPGCLEPADGGAEADAADFDAVCSLARQHLREGRCDEAMTAITAVEDAVRANVEREPGRELSILMIKARAYWHQMDTEGLEQFLTQFDQQYADTSAARWVQRAAWYERMLGYRFAEDLPQAVQAFEKYRELEEQAAAGQDRTDAFDAAERDFDLHVKMPAEIGDLYRYMGKTDLALEKYRSALDYVTAHFATFEAAGRQRGAAHRQVPLPFEIQGRNPPDGDPRMRSAAGQRPGHSGSRRNLRSPTSRLAPDRRPGLLPATGDRFRKAALPQSPANPGDSAKPQSTSLPPTERTRYLTLHEHIAGNLDACNAELVRLSAAGL